MQNHKGNLEVDFSSEPTQEDLRACAAAWEAQGECVFEYRGRHFNEEGILER